MIIRPLTELTTRTVRWMLQPLGLQTGRIIALPFLLYTIILILYYSLFNITPIMEEPVGLWQFLPTEELRDSPWQSLYYLHSRPPLANALLALGYAINIGPNFLSLLNHIAGLMIIVYTFLLLHHLTEGRRILLFLFGIILYSIRINFLVFLNSILYTMGAAGLIMGAAYHAFRFQDKEQWRDLAICSFYAAMLSMYRASYGIPFFLVLAILLSWKQRRGLLILVSAIPAILWSFKNWILFGHFALTTLLGMTLNWNASPSIYRKSFGKSVKWEKTREYVRQNHPDLAPLLKGTLLKISVYEQEGYQTTKRADLEQIPVLARKEKDDWWGASNKNAYEYIQISEDFERLNKILILEHPLNYLLNITDAFYLFLKPSWMYAQFISNQWNPHPHLFEWFHLPKIDEEVVLTRGVIVSQGWDLFLPAYFVAIALLLAELWRPLAFNRSQAFLFLFFIALGTAAGILISNVESMRYKFEIEAMTLTLALGLVTRRLIAHRPLFLTALPAHFKSKKGSLSK